MSAVHAPSGVPKQTDGTFPRGTFRLSPLWVLPLWVLVLAVVLPAAQQDERKPYSFSTDVRLVVLHASVTDHKGRPVPGLDKEDFQIWEDGHPQQIRFFLAEDAPATVGLIIDHSASMIPNHREVIAAAMALVNASNPGDELFAVAFNERPRLVLPSGETFAKSREELRDALNSQMPTGQTALYDAVALGLDQLEKGTASKKVLVVLSDGGDNASRAKADHVSELARRANAIIYAIGIYEPTDRETKPGVLKRLASMTGGEAFFPKTMKQTTAICLHIARDVRAQYSLGYVPPAGAREGAFRKVRVAATGARGEKLHVRTRSGYYESCSPGAKTVTQCQP